MRNTYLTVGIIVVILVVVAFAVVRSRLSQIGQLGESTPTSTPVQETTKPALTVSKHTPASTAVVDSATLTNSGFIVIHESQNGEPAEVLGVSDLLAPGTYTNVDIKLSRKTTNGESLFAMIHSDNGDGKFELDKDEPVKGEGDSPLRTQIQVTAEGGSGFQTPATGLGDE